MSKSLPFVYLVEAQNGMIKIGCSDKPEARLVTILTHSPVPVRLIAKWPGQIADEVLLHKQFSQYRAHGEWFAAVGNLQEFVRAKFGMGLDRVEDFHAALYLNREERRERCFARRSASMKSAWADPTRSQNLRDRSRRRKPEHRAEDIN